MSPPDEPPFDSDPPVPNEASGVGADVTRDYELVIVRQQIASALFPLRNIASPKIGRFVVERRLGAGAMGVVYAARDPALDRRVAIKLVRPDVGGDPKAQLRLEREAKALAKLSHPNIVAIHEVGEHEGQVFLAMEHVQGLTLRAWQERAPRSTAEVLGMYVQAGRGLAAAHAAGLVHRDFKPDNVLVDDDGRARVVDFGLVGGDERERRAELARLQASGDGSVLVLTTHTHALVGTPAYMSPEQLRGTTVDACSDQFSFCVALWEALYGERPFCGPTLAELAAEIAAGRRQPPPKTSRVPPGLQRACERGLSVDPAQRWPSMEALVDELHRLATPRRRGWLALGLVGGLAVLAAGLVASRYVEVMHRCEGARQQLAGIWDDARRRAARDAILGTGLPYAEDAWVRVEPRLDEYADAWAHKHGEVCEATSVRHEQSPEVMDLRMACLRDRQLALRETVEVLAEADPVRVKNAVGVVAGLPDLSRCDDVEALRAELPPPEDPQTAALVSASQERLAHVRALLSAGVYDEGLAEADAVVGPAEGLGHPPLLIEALFLRGKARQLLGRYAEAEQDLERAYLLALEHEHDELEAKTTAALVVLVGVDPARSEAVDLWGRTALALARSARVDDEAEALASNNFGMALEIQGRLEEALAHHQRALELWERLPSTDQSRIAATLLNIGTVLGAQGKLEEAVVYDQRALALFEEALGPRHPNVGTTLNNLGAMLHRLRRLDEALVYNQRALAIWEAIDPRHADVAAILDNIGATLRAQGRLAEALSYHRRAVAISESALGPRHPDVASSLAAIGVVLTQQGELEDALEHLRRAASMMEEALGPRHAALANVLNKLGNALRDHGELEEALRQHQRALAIREEALGPRHHEVGASLVGIGNVLLDRGRLDEARSHYERALELSEEALGPGHPQVAAARQGLGDVLRRQGRLDEARAHHAQALATWEQALGARHPDTAGALVRLAELALEQGDHGRAREHAERAVSSLETSEVSPLRLAAARFVLARALWADGEGRDRARAAAQADQARAAFHEAGERGTTAHAELDAWVAARDP